MESGRGEKKISLKVVVRVRGRGEEAASGKN